MNIMVHSVYFLPFISLAASIYIMVKSKSSWRQIVKDSRPTNVSISTRNLSPQDLGAVIFGCTNNTIAECHSWQLFGISLNHDYSLNFVFAELSYSFSAFVLFSSKGNICHAYQSIAIC